jgi:hypothetical protein
MLQRLEDGWRELDNVWLVTGAGEACLRRGAAPSADVTILVMSHKGWMRLQQKLATKATAWTQPGEQVQTVIPAYEVLGGIGRVGGLGQKTENRYLIVATDRRYLLGRWIPWLGIPKLWGNPEEFPRSVRMDVRPSPSERATDRFVETSVFGVRLYIRDDFQPDATAMDKIATDESS